MDERKIKEVDKKQQQINRIKSQSEKITVFFVDWKANQSGQTMVLIKLTWYAKCTDVKR